MDTMLQLACTGLSHGVLYALASAGFALIIQASGTFNFAHGQFFTVGAFFFVALFTGMHSHPILACIIALGGSFLFGAAVGFLFPRPASNTKSMPRLLLLTVGLAVLLKGLFGVFEDHVGTYYAGALSELSSEGSRLVSVPPEGYVALGLAVFVLVLLCVFYKYSHQGMYMRALADNPRAALAVGVNRRKVCSLAWGIAALACALSGITLLVTESAGPYELSSAGLRVFLIVVIGGLGRFWGAIFAGIAIGVIEPFSLEYLPAFTGEALICVILLLTLAVKPYGLFNNARHTGFEG